MEKRAKQAFVGNKDDDVDNNDDDGDDNSNDGADMHLAHITQVGNNVKLGVCVKNLTHVVKDTLTSLISDFTGH
eukprot:15182117-Ditylum_brightwellii.AAC.1